MDSKVDADLDLHSREYGSRPEIAAHPREDRPTLALLFMSWYGDEKTGGHEGRVSPLLPKLFTPAELVETVEEALAVTTG
jgi:hypothetical protein